MLYGIRVDSSSRQCQDYRGGVVSGTGKELVVNLIHEHSPRSQQLLVIINCAAIPHTLLERQLFGHERGAFTGAPAKQAKAMQAANQGTLTLDEVGDLTPSPKQRFSGPLKIKNSAQWAGATPLVSGSWRPPIKPWSN
jgi:sigma54-dependent transcription regulator